MGWIGLGWGVVGEVDVFSAVLGVCYEGQGGLVSFGFGWVLDGLGGLVTWI